MTPRSTTESAGFRAPRRGARARWWTPADGAAGAGAPLAREASVGTVTLPGPPPGILPPGQARPSQTTDPFAGPGQGLLPLPPELSPRGPGRHARPPGRRRPGQTPPGRRSGAARARRLVGVVVLAALLVIGFSLGRALGRPTSDTASAKLAEWARDHRLGGVVSFLEQKQLDLHPAKTGGTVAGGFHPGGATAQPSAKATAAVAQALPHTQAPVNLQPFGTTQPGEGQWQVLARVGGLPALEYAGLTPDAVHTSYVASVAWMDPKLLRFELRPGAPSGDPGGSFPGFAPTLAGTVQQRMLVAAFNGGFRLNGESQGGFYLAGHTGRALVSGAASMVVYRNGSVAVGQWGRDVKLAGNVVGVRQNLRLLVDHGTLSPTVDQSNSPVWGFTLGGTQATWRSGVGVTRTGAVVYVDGPAMTTRTLGQVLQRAGAVNAMELDINPEWTHFDYFTRGTTGTVANKLNEAQQAPADKYLSTEPSSRDFVAVFARTS